MPSRKKTRALDLNQDMTPSTVSIGVPIVQNHDLLTGTIVLSPADSHRSSRSACVSSPLDLTSTDLQAPVSAVYNMSSIESPDDLIMHETTKKVDAAVHVQKFRPGSMFERGREELDIISRGILDQSHARTLFNQFMSNACSFTPLFDPVFDSFDRLRQREPLCFTVILTLACRLATSFGDASNVSQSCLKEIKVMVGETLFQCAPSLGAIQAIILLAAYTDDTWFAIGHALQMAIDLGLDNAVPQLLNPSGDLVSRNEQRRLTQKARTWLALCFMEREIAMGTARHSKIDRMKLEDLNNFIYQTQAQPSDMRLTSLVEAVDARYQFQHEITSAESLIGLGSQKLSSVESRFEQWLQHWDRLHEERGYDAASFQRISLQGQKNYAVIYSGCAILGRLSTDQPLSVIFKACDGPPQEILQMVTATAMKQLGLVLRAESYKWQLRWATSYTILSLTFTAVFVLEVLRYRTDLVESQEVLTVVNGIANILKDYHDVFFYNLVQIRFTQHSGYLAANRSRINGKSREHDHNHTRLESPPEASPTGDSVQNPLDDILETPNWMINPTSMLDFSLPDWNANDTFMFDSFK